MASFVEKRRKQRSNISLMAKKTCWWKHPRPEKAATDKRTILNIMARYDKQQHTADTIFGFTITQWNRELVCWHRSKPWLRGKTQTTPPTSNPPKTGNISWARMIATGKDVCTGTIIAKIAKRHPNSHRSLKPAFASVQLSWERFAPAARSRQSLLSKGQELPCIVTSGHKSQISVYWAVSTQQGMPFHRV